MAYEANIYCTKCGENKTVIVGVGGVPGLICDSCKSIAEVESRDKYFADLGKLPIEERIRKIEEWQYDYRPTHVPPPRF